MLNSLIPVDMTIAIFIHAAGVLTFSVVITWCLPSLHMYLICACVLLTIGRVVFVGLQYGPVVLFLYKLHAQQPFSSINEI